MKLVISPTVDDARLERIVEAVDGDVVNALDEDDATMAIVDADAFFGKMTPTLLGAAKRLRWIQSPTASLEHYLFPELVEHPSTLTNMRGIFSDVIADHAMSYTLCFARNLHTYIRQQVEGRWETVGGEETRVTFSTAGQANNPRDMATIHLADATFGVVGLGGIGLEIARRAASFGMDILAVDAEANAREWSALPGALREVWPTERLDDLLTASDFVCIAAPHTPETYKLFRSAQFQRMKPTAYLINIGRGVIVDLTDLTAALEAKEIAGAALDVFETEPLPEGHPLWKMENVIITPHVAGLSPRVAERHFEVFLDNLARFQEGRPLKNIADKVKWY